MAKTPYSKRSDIEKIKSQWNKLNGLHSRGEWSSAVVRAATAVELSINFAIKKEMEDKSLDFEFIGHLIKWANGANGKMEKLLVPLLKTHGKNEKLKEIKKIKSLVIKIHQVRNEIVHSGHFKKQETSQDLTNKCKICIETIVGLYEAGFYLTPQTHEKQSTSN